MIQFGKCQRNQASDDKILVILSAAKDLAERSDTGRAAGVRSFAALRATGKRPMFNTKVDMFICCSTTPLPPCRWRKRKPSMAIEPMPYAELQVTTNYSFLRGGSHPGELVSRRRARPYAIGIADRNTLAGVVRAYSAIKEYYEGDERPRRSRSSCWSARDSRRATAIRCSPIR
jgi:hypothetical protein